jgi:uncharacterized protein YecA (UPF0149 family)
MFDNRWDNWAGDFAESFGAELLEPQVRAHVSEILTRFGEETRKIDREFPDEISPGTFAKVMTETMPRLALPEDVRPHVPEVVARFLEYLRESGRVAEGSDWAAQVRVIGHSYRERLKPGGGVKGETIRKPLGVATAGRNDPCPCGSGKKYKKCCMTRGS